MSSYLNWQTKKTDDWSDASINSLYDRGFVATRVDKGIFNQTRSFRISLNEYTPSSENRRILKKMDDTELVVYQLPYRHYHWTIHKLAKEFYTTKFGADTFSANKVKELLQDPGKSNFNRLFVYRDKKTEKAVGYCIALVTDSILHYSYPFYEQGTENPSLGLGMMTMAITWAKEKGLSYAYLGSLQRPSDTYKLQFEGQEWFDGSVWQKDLTPLKNILN